MSRAPKVTRELCEQLKSLSEDGLSVKGLAKFGGISYVTASVLKRKGFDFSLYGEYKQSIFERLKQKKVAPITGVAVSSQKTQTEELLEKLKLHIDQISVGLNLLLKEAQK